MAREGVTTTGLREMRAAVRMFPRAEQEALRAVAWRVSRRVTAGAKQRLRAQTKGTGATADAIVVREDAEQKRFIVESKAPAGAAANLPMWLEFGTSKQAPRPYMSPAAQAENESYTREMRAVSERVARDTFRG